MPVLLIVNYLLFNKREDSKMRKIKNTESLSNHGDRESRKKITELLSACGQGGRIPSD